MLKFYSEIFRYMYGNLYSGLKKIVHQEKSGKTHQVQNIYLQIIKIIIIICFRDLKY